jgi:CRISPR-associated exonuclease Cas4
MMIYLLVVFLLLLGAFLLWLGARQQRTSGLPAGRVLYTDPKIMGQPEKPFFDAGLMLTGKPDYLVEDGGVLIPVEVKSGWAPSEPHSGHIYQLMAYCILIERSTNRRPPYGILRYRNRTFAIDFTPQAEQDLLALLDEIQDAGRREQQRSHDEPARCTRCGFRTVCDQRL